MVSTEMLFKTPGRVIRRGFLLLLIGLLLQGTASAEIPFSADSLVSSGKYIFAAKENRFCRLDAETLSDMRMFSSDAADDLQKCAQGLALARPDGRILLLIFMCRTL